MVVHVADLIFNDTPSRYNHDLTEFIKRNIKTIIMRAQLKFRFKIARPSDLKSLRTKGIKRLPAMVIQGQRFIGVPTIVEELSQRVKKSKKLAPVKTNDEIVNDYFRKALEINQDKDGHITVPQDNDFDDNSDNLMDQFQKELSRRQAVNAERNPFSNTRQVPSQPDRQAEQDNDYEPPQYQSRNNNINEEAAPAGDPLTTLNRLQRTSKGANKDDDMMRQLLERMG